MPDDIDRLMDSDNMLSSMVQLFLKIDQRKEINQLRATGQMNHILRSSYENSAAVQPEKREEVYLDFMEQIGMALQKMGFQRDVPVPD